MSSEGIARVKELKKLNHCIISITDCWVLDHGIIGFLDCGKNAGERTRPACRFLADCKVCPAGNPSNKHFRIIGIHVFDADHPHPCLWPIIGSVVKKKPRQHRRPRIQFILSV